MKKTEIVVSKDIIPVEDIVKDLDKNNPLTLVTKQILENLRKYQLEEMGEGRTKLELAHLKVAGDQICMNLRLKFESDRINCP